VANQKQTRTARILILESSQNDAEAVVNLLRNAGQATRAHRITSAEDLNESLEASQWDLCLAREGEVQPSPDEVLAAIRKRKLDIPFVLLLAEHNPDRTVAMLNSGAADAVIFDHHQHLLRIMQREIGAREARDKCEQLTNQLAKTEERCKLLLESSREAIAYVDDGMHIYANPAYMKLMGFDDLDDLICVPFLDLLADGHQEDYRNFVRDFAESQEDGQQLAVTLHPAEGAEFPADLFVSHATYDGDDCAQLLVRKTQNGDELAERLRQLQREDQLTGLFSRQYFMQSLESVIEQAARDNVPAALAYVSLDRFVRIKADHGLAGGDAVLAQIADLFRSHFPENSLVARLGDDAFGVLCSDCTPKDFTELCQSFLKTVADHVFQHESRSIQLTLSIGIAPINEHSPERNALLSRAHQLSEDAHEKGGDGNKGNNLKYYEASLDNVESEAGMIELISAALDEDRFRLLFQPVINLRGEEDEHYEAFVRLMDGDNNEIAPLEFLPPKGAAALATRIDRWVILQTIRQLAGHRSKGHDTRLFLNLTTESILDETLPEWLERALTAAKLPGDSLIFQIQENQASAFIKQAQVFAKAVRGLKSKVSLSQFGKESDPYKLLKHIEVDYIKFDGSFTARLQDDAEARETLKTMVSELQERGMVTVIPFVENASTLATLWQAGANYIQGYYVQEPVPEMNYDFGD